ncbi:MAG: hypothetical protein WDN03_14005 [Rhizomicrobium sp.]
MEKIPALFQQMRDNLVPARVPAIHATTVAKQNGGVMQVVDGMVMPQAASLDAAGQARLKAAGGCAAPGGGRTAGLAGQGSGAQCAGRFPHRRQAVRREAGLHAQFHLSRKEIRDRAEAAVKATRAQMYAAARLALAGQARAPAMPDGADAGRAAGR